MTIGQATNFNAINAPSSPPPNASFPSGKASQAINNKSNKEEVNCPAHKHSTTGNQPSVNPNKMAILPAFSVASHQRRNNNNDMNKQANSKISQTTAAFS